MHHVQKNVTNHSGSITHVSSSRLESNASRRRPVDAESPQQIYERYLALAREEARAGDRVEAENYYQHAEHYFRLMSTLRGD